jgi:hypothetical protein
MVQLSPPWYTLWNELKYTIGKDVSFRISDLDVSQNPYRITIITDDTQKGSALATIIKLVHDFGKIQVTIHIQDSNGTPYEGFYVTNSNELALVIRMALQGNPLFRNVYRRPTAAFFLSKDVFPVFKKTIIQFYNDDLSDYYMNYNNVASHVFANVLKDNINGLYIHCSTEDSG